ncbi:putative homeobox-leucine zipper protein HOX26 [Zea mays]|uniref:Homeobox domain-containing protein n=1 Tax=Zea mays TaxID=4577 RepID=A0A804P4I3_MAIZE|eukprot:XP_008679947.1 putative homeobox-leucine zipper protein HOX26 [Zea mays]
MSSLTTAASSSSSMEEHCYSVSAEEVVGTHLSLGIGGGGGGGDKRMLTTLPPSRTVVQLFGEVLSVQDGDEAQALRHHHTGRPTAASRKKKRRDAAAGGASATDAAANGHHHQSKKTKTTAARRDDGGGGGGGGRKKLRLTAAQATLLEDSFRAHNILSHGEKQELARQAGLSARQVEVWFQNRRARTKLKQTEVDCDLLRRWCARLSDDNDRLRRDLADLRRAAAASAGLGAVVCCASCGADRQLALAAAADNVLPSVASPSHSPHLT